MKAVVVVFACINLSLTYYVLFRLHQPTTLFLWMIKVAITALSPILAVIGLLLAVSGWMLDSTISIFAGGVSAVIYVFYMYSVTRPPDATVGFDQAFGPTWKKDLPATGMLSRRYVFMLFRSQGYEWRQDVVFHTYNESGRKLLCDLWLPPAKVKRSGLAFIYIHGSAWAVLDKDVGTRRFFSHLAAQGHVIMDVAHRLFPEADMTGMTHDVNYAIAWLKSQAESLGFHSDKIVIGGGSAGAHLALLASYSTGNHILTPSDLMNSDLRVCGVVSLYGQGDLKATFYHTCQHIVYKSALVKGKAGEPGGMPSWIQKSIGRSMHRLGFDKDVQPGMLIPMLGGDPVTTPGLYELYSPATYAGKTSPATLFIHGTHDILAPTEPVKKLQKELLNSGVPAILHLIPGTDHAFDLIFPSISPSAHNAIFDVERFLAVLAVREANNSNKTDG